MGTQPIPDGWYHEGMDDGIAAARERIARQRGRLTGWRPLRVSDDVAVIALEVLGDVRAEPGQIGMRVVVAGRTPEAVERDGVRGAETALRRRAVLGPDDPLVVERHGPIHDEGQTPTLVGPIHTEGDGEGGGTMSRADALDDLLTWPWRTLAFHVPAAYLPAIAGLTTDRVHGD